MRELLNELFVNFLPTSRAAAEAAYRHANKSQCVFTDKGRENVPLQTNEAYCTVTTGVVMKRNQSLLEL